MPSLEPASNAGILPYKILVIGGSYGGLAAAFNLLDLCASRPARFTGKPTKTPRVDIEIKLVDRRDGYFHTISAPLALASSSYNAKAWQRFEEMPCFRTSGISWMQGDVLRVDPVTKLAVVKDAKSGEIRTEKYDYLVASSGLSRAWPVVPQALNKSDYLEETGTHIDTVRNVKDGVVVVGGGAVGVEMAAEIKHVHPTQKVTLIHSRGNLLSSEPLPEEFKDRVLQVVKELGVEVILNDRVIDVQPLADSTSSRLILMDGSRLVAGHVIWALSKSVPTTTYLPDDSLDPEGFVKIAPTMQFTHETPNHAAHFAIGDLAAWSGIKRCGGAMHMGAVAANNIHQLLLHDQHGYTPRLLEIPQFENMIAVAIGTKAVMYSPQDGTTSGEEQMKQMFGKDLGWSIVWNYIQLGEEGNMDVVGKMS